MDYLSKSAKELSKKLEENGFGNFNFHNGPTGADFKSGILVHIRELHEPDFPIYTTTVIGDVGRDIGYATARFGIVKDETNRLRVESVRLAYYENCNGGKRVMVNLDVKSLQDIPSKEQASNILEKLWESKKNRDELKLKDLTPSGKHNSFRKL